MTRLAVLTVGAVCVGAASVTGTLAAQDARTVAVAFLTKGPAWTAGATPALDQLQRDHGAFLDAMTTSGKALVSGPIGDDGALRGAVILAAASVDDGRAQIDADPAIKAGRLAAEVFACQIAPATFVLAPKPDPPTRQFALVVLSAGGVPAEGMDQTATREAHDAYLSKLRESGVLVMGCALNGAGDRRALLVFAVDAPAGARALMTADPMVAGGLLTADVHPWFAGDGVMRAAK